MSLQPLLLSDAPYKTWLGELPPEQVPRLDTAGVVDELANMFPMIDRDVIEAVAESSDNSLERALEQLLAISDDQPASAAALSGVDGLLDEDRQIKEDELLALQLYQQFAAEDRARSSGAVGGVTRSNAERMFEAIQQEGSEAHAQFQQQPEGVREALLKQLTRMRAKHASSGIKGASPLISAPPPRPPARVLTTRPHPPPCAHGCGCTGDGTLNRSLLEEG